jgi:hypothetical protein
MTGAGEPVTTPADGSVESGTCQARKKVGGACKTDADCLSRICAPRINSTLGVCAEEIILTPSEPICVDL